MRVEGAGACGGWGDCYKELGGLSCVLCICIWSYIGRVYTPGFGKNLKSSSACTKISQEGVQRHDEAFGDGVQWSESTRYRLLWKRIATGPVNQHRDATSPDADDSSPYTLHTSIASKQLIISSPQYPEHQHLTSTVQMPSLIHPVYSSVSLYPFLLPRTPFTCMDVDIPNQRIDLHRINIIKLLQRLLDLPLIRLDIHNKNQRVVLLDLLHRALRVQRVDDDFVLVEAWLMGDGLARVFGGAGELEGLGSVEGC